MISVKALLLDADSKINLVGSFRVTKSDGLQNICTNEIYGFNGRKKSLPSNQIVQDEKFVNIYMLCHFLLAAKFSRFHKV